MLGRTVERQWTLEHVQEQIETAVDDERRRWEGIVDQALNRSSVPYLLIPTCVDCMALTIQIVHYQN
jgi:hypothetical protein